MGIHQETLTLFFLKLINGRKIFIDDNIKLIAPAQIGFNIMLQVLYILNIYYNICTWLSSLLYTYFFWPHEVIHLHRLTMEIISKSMFPSLRDGTYILMTLFFTLLTEESYSNETTTGKRSQFHIISTTLVLSLVLDITKNTTNTSLHSWSRLDFYDHTWHLN